MICIKKTRSGRYRPSRLSPTLTTISVCTELGAGQPSLATHVRYIEHGCVKRAGSGSYLPGAALRGTRRMLSVVTPGSNEEPLSA